ncbi:hypothetical protein R3W88_004322 [Solanum pinnatisectum]|uniref:Uncharacterized protein n=1 Tax=Solanum pinnatisectum TaxID=50273 RepID=A0AAV9K957_9SOLN|nr:hypothetical protein R3W88_004322 [Solanum pinnatisectum]
MIHIVVIEHSTMQSKELKYSLPQAPFQTHLNYTMRVEFIIAVRGQQQWMRHDQVGERLSEHLQGGISSLIYFRDFKSQSKKDCLLKIPLSRLIFEKKSSRSCF